LKKNVIPTFSIRQFTHGNDDVFMIQNIEDTKGMPMHLPYRTAYYGFGLVLKGEGTIKINLEEYDVAKGTMIAISPEKIKQWLKRTEDLHTLTLFFTKAYYTNYLHNNKVLDSFPFFSYEASHCDHFTEKEISPIKQRLLEMRSQLNSSHPYKNVIIAHLLNIALFEYSVIYDSQKNNEQKKTTRGKQLVDQFRNLVGKNFVEHKQLQYYADQLFITPKHLTESIKQETGKSAGVWIDEMLILEAKVLLQDRSLTVSEVSIRLNFPDQSTFGKFFKKMEGISPKVYKERYSTSIV
jgi:AraC family transcriptional regulator, transcriptional activator of pobA